jgi:hypothetical protein
MDLRNRNPALATPGLGETDHAGELILPTDKTPNQCGQACGYCRRVLSPRSRGKAGRKRRFCSTTCRVAFSREKLLRNRSGYNYPCCYEIGSKTLENSKGCKAKKEHPYPLTLNVPLDLLGRGCRWPGAPKLDGETRRKILWREVCAP